jgi:signal transduction histidine kinase
MNWLNLGAAELVDRLAEHRTLGRAPRQELAWLVAHGSLRQLQTGDILTPKGDPVAALFIVLEGRIAIFLDRGTGLHKVLEWPAGDVTGILPYSRLTTPPADTIAQEPTTILAVDREWMRDLVLECQEVTTILVHAMLDRSRAFTSSDLHDEKMLSLGKLSAGLAHELNNPVAAIERSASLLEDRLDQAQLASRALGAARLSDAQLDAVDALRNACLAANVQGVRSPIEQAAHEERIADWLADHRVSDAIADALAETGVTLAALDNVATVISGPALETVMRWAGAGCSVHRLASEIQEAAMRISGLVTAIKGFTHMDQATVAEPVDLLQGLSNTVAVLQSKARHKSAAIAVHAEPGLPRVFGFPGELNQIWANLIDNALDALSDGGRIEIEAGREGPKVAVRIIDNGPGIPDKVRDRIFDPFFTTKPMGQGTGLGLDIVRRLVLHNQGDITVTSRPGRTEFRVVLPLAETAPGASS